MLDSLPNQKIVFIPVHLTFLLSTSDRDAFLLAPAQQLADPHFPLIIH